jgi:hypothetical protein
MSETPPQTPVATIRTLPLRHAANQLDVTPAGALKILKRAGVAIRADGRWYARPADIHAIERARSVLGMKARTGALQRRCPR